MELRNFENLMYGIQHFMEMKNLQEMGHQKEKGCKYSKAPIIRECRAAKNFFNYEPQKKTILIQANNRENTIGPTVRRSKISDRFIVHRNAIGLLGILFWLLLFCCLLYTSRCV